MTDLAIGGGIMPRPPWITPAELSRVHDRHDAIEQDPLPDTSDQDDTEEDL